MTTPTKPAWFTTEIANLKAEKQELEERIADLERYLRSSKFYEDPTVQVTDVLNRLGRW